MGDCRDQREDTKEEAEEHAKLWKEHVVVEYSEEKRLQDKKKQIKEDLYDKVKMEQFKESSRLEGMTPGEALDEMVRWGEEHGLYELPPQGGITPDAWVIVEISGKIQKIIAGWSGGYTQGDAWRMSSPIKELNIDIDKDYITAITDSGSEYTLYKKYQGLRMSNVGIYNQLKEQFRDRIEIVTL